MQEFSSQDVSVLGKFGEIVSLHAPLDKLLAWNHVDVQYNNCPVTPLLICTS